MKNFAAALIAASFLFAGSEACACSTFCFDTSSGPIFGKNYDWSVEDGLLIVNKRGVTKQAITDDSPAKWTSRYGSVTFNQYGREFPCGGMNEAGLVVELMWLDEAEYPAPDDRTGLSVLQWIQYQMDNSATVGDLIDSDSRVRITRAGTAAIHFLVADSSGACAAIEFLGGKLVAHSGRTMPFRALTNSTYENSVAYSRRFRGSSDLPRTSRSLDRFVRAAHMSQTFVGDSYNGVLHAFGILSDVAQGEHTKWSIVYELTGRRIHFKTHAQGTERYIDFAALDFGCDTPVTMVDLNAPLGGDLSEHLVPYTRTANFDLIVTAFRETDFLSKVPRKSLETLSRYPESTTCPAGAD
jgi:penicillin V acylase-like amidase (Ntn superfamily)